MEPAWKLINTLAVAVGQPYIVGYNYMGGWVVRSAVWSDGRTWLRDGFKSLEDAAGWWSVETAVVQDKIVPTHYLMPTPDVG